MFMIDRFDTFLNENRESLYRLYIDDDESMVMEGSDDWDIVMDFSELWDKYSKKEINLEKFVYNYKYKINEYKNTIIKKKGVDVWDDLVIILNDFKDYNKINSHRKFDEVYDWADKNNIKIKTKL